MKNLGFLSLFILLIFSACRKDIDMVTVTEEIPNPEIIEGYQPLIEIINGDLIGRVVGNEGQPIVDAMVTLGTNNTTTDIYGHFFFNDVDMNSKGQYVTIEKDGYFLGSRRFFPQADATSRVKVEMLNKSFNQSFNTNNPETVTVGLVDIDFPANGIVDENGVTYTGNVFVAGQWLRPTEKRVYDQMPGNLSGVTTESEEVALKTLGMIAVELQGENGEKLNIMEGAAASFSYIIPDGLNGNVPAEIPLWSFNDEVGIWVEEGIATLSADGTYQGEFTHFSFWNWDIPAGNVYFSATFQDQDGNPLQNVLVTLTSTTYGAGNGYTDDQGYVSGIIPAEDLLTMGVWASFSCATSFYSAEIGPFTEDVDLGIIVVEDTSVNATSVTGRLINCDGDAIAGVVSYELDGYFSYNYTDEEGNFSFYLNNCVEFEEASLTGYDFAAGFSSNPVPLTPNADNEVGDILACENDISENVLTIMTSEGEWEYPTMGFNSADGLSVSLLEADSVEIGFYINPDEVSVGVIASGGSIYAFNNYNPNPEWTYTLLNPNEPHFDYLEITELNDEFFSGVFSIQMNLGPDITQIIDVEGTFHVLLQ